MAESFFINDFEVGVFLNPYLIAEIGVNHEGDMNLAKRLIDQAASGGAHAAKFQSYKAEKLASRNSPAYWDTTLEPTESQYKLFQKYDSFDLMITGSWPYIAKGKEYISSQHHSI